MNEIEFAARQDEILSELPQEFRGAVSFKAYQDGHAGGYEEVMGHLIELVDMLKQPIIDYTARIKQS